MYNVDIMEKLNVKRDVSARVPTMQGDSSLVYYVNNLDDKEHVALVTGDVQGKDDVVVRVHSECFTGDVFGSRRCDCGNQLAQAMERISEIGSGVIIYLRQEGRGIGLRDKLRAYNLQDEGYDTVDANLELGHEVDERDYQVACLILEDLGITSVRLLTNNQDKVDALVQSGIEISSRESIEAIPNDENIAYLSTKSERMGHILDLKSVSFGGIPLPELVSERSELGKRPFITVTYAQSLDGSIAFTQGSRFSLSGDQANSMTHGLRSAHDSILVGIGTILADDPDLTVRKVEGLNPQPVVLDSNLRFPLTARLLHNTSPPTRIFTSTTSASEKKEALENAGIKVSIVETDNADRLDLNQVLRSLYEDGFRSIMVEGGQEVITEFISQGLVDYIVITITPSLLGGLNAIGDIQGMGMTRPRLNNIGYRKLGEDLVIWGSPTWENID